LIESYDVAILAAPFGFGPLSKALAVAEALLDQDVSVKILSDTRARTIVEASNVAFAEYTYRSPMRAQDLGSGFVLSCMDMQTPIAKDPDGAIGMLDSLLWLRAEWETALDVECDVYFAQRFLTPIDDELGVRLGERLCIVDAILPIGSLSADISERSDRTLLYPGGLRTPHMTDEEQAAYLYWSWQVVKSAFAELEKSARDIVALVPDHLLSSRAVSEMKGAGADVISGVRDVHACLQRVNRVVAPPGIEIVLDSAAAGAEMCFLPSYLGPHVPQLAAMLNHEMGFDLAREYHSALFAAVTASRDLGAASRSVVRSCMSHVELAGGVESASAALVARIQIGAVRRPRFPLGSAGATQVAGRVLEYLR
jgi:hypothetical protein